MGMEVFALGNLLLGVAYAFVAGGGVADHRAIGFINHTMTLGAPVVCALARGPLLQPPVPVCCAPAGGGGAVHRCAITGAVHLAQQARHAMPYACALLFWRWWWRCFMACAVRQRHAGRDDGFAVLIAGICGLNAAKLVMILHWLARPGHEQRFPDGVLRHVVPWARCCRPAWWAGAAPPDR